MRILCCKIITILLICNILISGCTNQYVSDASCYENGSNFIQTNQNSSAIVSRFIILKNHKWGFIDHAGNVVVKPQFSYIRHFEESRAAFKNSDDLWGFINSEGTPIIQPQFDKVSDFIDGKAVFKKDNKWGIINSYGQIIVDNRFEELRPVGEQLYKFKLNNKWGIINYFGEIIVNADFNKIGHFNDRRAAFSIKQNEREAIGFINPKGKTIFKLPKDVYVNHYQDAEGVAFSNGRLSVLAYSPGLTVIRDFLSSRASSGQLKDKWGIIDTSGKQVVPFKYDSIGLFSQCLAAVRVGNKVGFINIDGKVVIRPQFENAFSFSEGLAQVKINGKWGYIDNQGKVVIRPQFENAFNFSNGLAEVQTDKKWGYINKEVQFVWSDSIKKGNKPTWRPIY